MQKTVDGTPVTATLVGGPESIRDDARVRQVDAREDKIKLPHQGGYEHFERVAEPAPGDLPGAVFRWTMRTKAAE